MFLEPCKNHEILLESLLNRIDECSAPKKVRFLVQLFGGTTLRHAAWFLFF